MLRKQLFPSQRRIMCSLLAGTFLLVITLVSCDSATENAEEGTEPALSIIPYPASVTMKGAGIKLTHAISASTEDEELLPCLELLSKNIASITGQGLDIVLGKKAGADIHFKLNTNLEESQYKIKISKSISIEGGSYGSLINASYSLLQVLELENNQITFPGLIIEDSPDSEYRGLMIDLARNWHNVPEILKLIDLAAYYKLNYVQLHFTDYQSYTLPSKHLPLLSTIDRHYSFDQLEEINAYALQRGIYIIPELEMPGHAKAMTDAYPEIFGIKDISKNPYAINMGKEEVYESLELLISELCEVFSESPYFHIGGDEAIYHMLDNDPDIQAYMLKENLGLDIHELYRHFVVRANEIVKKQGKQMCVWEGFRREGTVEIPKDIIVFEYESAFYLPGELVDDGYTVVNASWKPLYVVNEKKWSPEYIYNWNIWRWENWFHKVPSYTPIQLEPANNIIGGQMCAWEQKQELEFPSLRQRVAAFSERIWEISEKKEFSHFEKRLTVTDKLLSKLANDSRQDTVAAFDK